MESQAVADLEEARRSARRALRNFVASIIATTGAIVGAVLSGDDVAFEIVLALGFAVVTFTGTNWWNARGVREADTQRVLTLASIFLQNPAELRQLIRTERLDHVVQNLLTTLLPTDDLGHEMWSQGVAPLVDRLREGDYRRNQVYDVSLHERPRMTRVTLPDGNQLEIDPDAWRTLSATLTYTRRFRDEPSTVWVGLVFDPKGGPRWFQDPNFVYREYMPVEESTIDAICSAMPSAPRVLQEQHGRRSRGRGRGTTAADRDRRARIAFAAELCCPTVSIDGEALQVDEVAADRQGLGMRFAVPPNLSGRLAGRRVSLVAGLSFPLPQRVSVFPVYFPDLTLGGRIVFRHGDAEVTDVVMDRFFSVSKPFDERDVVEKRDRLEIGSQKWIFPDAGMVFSWRNRPAPGADPTASMVSPPMDAHPRKPTS